MQRKDRMASSTQQLPISEKIDRLKMDFQSDKEWEKKYERLLKMGKALPAMPLDLKSEQTKVRGCQSQVWMVAEPLGALSGPGGRLKLQADSDAAIVKGLVALLVEVYDGATFEEILQTKPSFLAEMGFDTHLSPSRANGLRSMIAVLYTRVFELSRGSSS